MAVRKIKYTVSAGGILPKSVQRGGVQGDHRATALQFTLDASLVSALESYRDASAFDLYYRFECYDGAGAATVYDSTELVFSSSGDTVLELLLENRLTSNGGRVSVYLIITAADTEENVTGMELYSFPAIIELSQKPYGQESEEENRESLTIMVERAKQCEQNADSAADSAAEARTAAEAARDEAAGYAEDLSDIRPRVTALETAIGDMNTTLAALVDVEG